jgi:hypothetical protein
LVRRLVEVSLQTAELFPVAAVRVVIFMPPVLPPAIVTELAALAVLPMLAVWVPVALEVLAMLVVEDRVEAPTEPRLMEPAVPPWMFVALVVLVEPIVIVCTAAPVAKLIVWFVAPLNKLVAAVPDSALKTVAELLLPRVMVLALVVPREIVPEIPAWIETAEAPVPPRIVV